MTREYVLRAYFKCGVNFHIKLEVKIKIMLRKERKLKKIDWEEIARDLRADQLPTQPRSIKWYYR
jgi:hypothetical protein